MACPRSPDRDRRLRDRLLVAERLVRLPADILKIDRSFVSGPDIDQPSAPLLEGVQGLAGRMSLILIAEGIETPEHLALLRGLGYPLGQGYLLSRPASAAAVADLLRRAEGRIAAIPAPRTPAETIAEEPRG